jgi:glutaredoxin
MMLVLISPAASAEVYQWTDRNGNVVFSDSPPAGKEAAVKRFDDERVRSGSPEPARAFPGHGTSPRSSGPGQRQSTKSYGDIDVILYSTAWCGYCTKARAYLAGLGVSVTEHDVDRDPARGEEMRAKSGSRGVPVVDVEGIIIRGYAPDQIRAAVEKRRAL